MNSNHKGAPNASVPAPGTTITPATFTLRDLEELYELKFKNLPAHAIPHKKYRDKTANELTKAIIAFCKLKGIMAYRQGTEGRYRQGKTYTDVIGRTRVMKGMYIPATKEGLGDITIVSNGKMISVEVKVGKDRQRDSQKDFEAELVKAGGVYQIVKTWEDFYNLVYLKHIQSNPF